MNGIKVRCLFFLVVTLLVGTLLISACETNQPILVGFSAGLTGRNGELGVDGRDGALLAVETLNNGGGVNGRPLKLIVRDDLSTAEGAQTADAELVQEGVVAIVGHMTSETMVAVFPKIQDTGIIYLSPTVSTPQLAGIKDNFFRLIPVNSYSASQLAIYAFDSLKLRKAVAFYDVSNQSFTKTYMDGFVNQFRDKGGDIAAEYAFSSPDEPDFRPMLMDAKTLQPDCVLVIASAVDTALIAQQVTLIGLDAQLLTSNWALTDDLIQNGGQAVEGILAVVSHDENNQSQRYLDFTKRFEERYGRRATFAAGYGYEAIMVLAAALKSTDGGPEGLNNALLKIQGFDGVHGQISFDEFGDVRRTLYLIAVDNGNFKTLATLEFENP